MVQGCERECTSDRFSFFFMLAKVIPSELE